MHSNIRYVRTAFEQLSLDVQTVFVDVTPTGELWRHFVVLHRQCVALLDGESVIGDMLGLVLGALVDVLTVSRLDVLTVSELDVLTVSIRRTDSW